MKLSIIIPVYNTAPFLSDCIGSCLSQTGVTLGEDYEIICVNDGSTDNSLAELRRLNPYENEKIHTNCTIGQGIENGLISICGSNGYIIVDQENKGVSSARNNGLTYAHGDYVWFVDSDDFIAANCLKPLLDFISIKKNDGIIFDVNFVSEKALRSESIQKGGLHPGIAKGETNVVWRYCIRKDFLTENNIKFDPTVSYCEDQLWQFWLFLFNPDFSTVTDKLYNYRNRATSAMNTHNVLSRQKHLESMLGMLRSYIYVEKNYKDKMNKQLRNAVLYNIHKSVQNIMFDLLRQPQSMRIRYFSVLKQEKLYPYPILWRTIFKFHSLKNLRINLFCLLFPIPLYYRALAKLNDRYHLF